jgi:hypothetical protein
MRRGCGLEVCYRGTGGIGGYTVVQEILVQDHVTVYTFIYYLIMLYTCQNDFNFLCAAPITYAACHLRYLMHWCGPSSCMCVYVYVCVCVCMCVYVCMCICVCICRSCERVWTIYLYVCPKIAQSTHQHTNG